MGGLGSSIIFIYLYFWSNYVPQDMIDIFYGAIYKFFLTFHQYAFKLPS